MDCPGGNPLRVGLEAAKANRIPLAVLWSLATALVLGYYFVPGVAAALEPLRRFQVEGGWFAAFLNRFFFCSVLPGVFVFLVSAIRPRRPLLTMLVQSVWCGGWGIVCCWFYGFQCWLFGDGIDFVTLLEKTAVNQFLWTPLCIAPVNSVFFFWLGRDMSLARTRREWPRHFIRDVYLPNLLSNWFVWVPMFFVIYAFPLPLQVQLSGIAGCVWSLVCIRVGALSRDRG